MDDNSYAKPDVPDISIRVKHNHSLGWNGPSNVHDMERLASVAGGAILLFWLGRRFWGILMMGFFGALLLYRGLTGHCILYSTLGINTNTSEFLPSSPLTPAGETPLERELRQESQRDKVDERSWQSFPASDP